MFATSSSGGEMVFFLMIVAALAFHGFRKMGKAFDKDGKVHDAAQKGVVGLLERWFKK